MVNYGGDEVAALVVDIGSSSLRAGYAGDDTPKAIVPTAFGYIEEQAASNGDVTMGEAGAPPEGEQPPAPKPKAKLFIGQNGPSLWRSGMQVGNPMHDGLVQNFDSIPPLVNHAFSEVLRVNPSEHPVLVTEAPWNTPANRERMAEIMFEEFQVPAFYIANTGVLNAFAAGKGSALVIDIGQSVASVTPVVDGFVLRKGLQHCALPQLVHAHAKHMLTSPGPNRPGQLIPHQLIASKMPVDAGVPAKFQLREDRIAGTTDTWRAWAEAREVDEWIQSVAGVLPQGWNEQAALQQGPRHYEFPTGFNCYFSGVERYAVGEQFFSHSQQLMASNPNLPKTMPALIMSSIQACDTDLRQVLMGNVVVTGGGSSFSGFTDRLAAELTRQFPVVKVHAPGNPTERKYGGWLGGSILASLGTFHQLWISREEWQEHGKAIVGQRCK
ncbi:actin-like protein Arp4p [Cubamyces menziesii]|nr:actin-like protein Arp4p [Cubamyces menziesii]